MAESDVELPAVPTQGPATPPGSAGDGGNKPDGLPRWFPQAVITTILLVAGALAAYWFLREIKGLLRMLVVALFLSFALEPAVNWMHAHGWRRGLATGAVLLTLLLSGILLIALMIPILVKEVQQLVQALPDWLDRLARFLHRCCGIDISTGKLIDQLKNTKTDLASYAANIAQNVLGIGAAILGALFQLFTIGLFTFYLVANGPKVRRAVCSLLPPERQDRVLWAWNTAIEKTGGYFYSRLLLAIINGSLMYVVLRILQIPFALPLSVFQGVVAEFIPIVGTYIGAAVPVIVALAESPTKAIILVIYVTIYQQAENAWLSPRLSQKTMELNAGIAFGAALAGGSVGGLVGAFLALPAAAVIQSFVGNYVKRYAVMESDLTRMDQPSARAKERAEAKAARTNLGSRLKDRLRRSKS